MDALFDVAMGLSYLRHYGPVRFVSLIPHSPNNTLKYFILLPKIQNMCLCNGQCKRKRNSLTEQKFKLFVSYVTPITVAARSKAWIVFARSNAGIVGSNPAQGMDVCSVCLFCVCVVLCVGSGLVTGWSAVQGVIPTVLRLRNWKGGQGAAKGCRAVDR
jgi:hypothetical protein